MTFEVSFGKFFPASIATLSDHVCMSFTPEKSGFLKSVADNVFFENSWYIGTIPVFFLFQSICISKGIESFCACNSNQSIPLRNESKVDLIS